MSERLSPCVPEYQFKHPKVVSLEYTGIAKDIIELNDPVTDGFMHDADIRADIVIATNSDRPQKPKSAFKLQLSRLLEAKDSKSQNKFTSVLRDKDVWYLAVDDNKLFKKVAAQEMEGKFDEHFVKAFEQEVKKGMKSVLKREKLLNSGNYNVVFTTSYIHFALFDLGLVPVIEAVVVANGNPLHIFEATTTLASMWAISNVAHNSLHLLYVGMDRLKTNIDAKVAAKLGIKDQRGPSMANFNDPFMRLKPQELFLPTVPVEKLIMGLRYLEKHGEELVKQVK